MASKKICIGTGLIALDVILNGNPKTPAKLQVGGSCGNVLTILSFLGWDSFPIARFGQNLASEEIAQELKKWKVSTKFVTRSHDGATPVIIHRILKDKTGNPRHRYEFKDPETGKWFPQYKPFLFADIESVTKRTKTPNFFYFDRASRAAVELAKHFKKDGALIFFEPSNNNSNPKLFKESLSVSDIVKFSGDRIANYSQEFEYQQASLLEIETRSTNGLRYRCGKKGKSKKWLALKAHSIDNIVDAAGAGDWTTAGLIHKLKSKNTNNLSVSDLKDAMIYGQSLGALSCLFEGARGLMQWLTRAQVNNLSKRIIANKDLNLNRYNTSRSAINVMTDLDFKSLLTGNSPAIKSNH